MDRELLSIGHQFTLEQIEAAAFLVASKGDPALVIKCLAAATKMLNSTGKLLQPKPKHEEPSTKDRPPSLPGKL